MNLLRLIREWSTSRTAWRMPPDLWPDTAHVSARQIQVGDSYSAVLLLVGYPAILPLGWLEHLVGNHARVETSIHIRGLSAETATARLHRRRARLESTRRYAANQGRLDDPDVEAAAQDAADLAGRIARGESQLHNIAVYVTVHASTTEELTGAVNQIRAAATAAMIDIRPATARQVPGLFSCLPLGVDAIGASRTVDTQVAAAAFPFTSADVPGTVSADAVLYGLNLVSGSPVFWDRWSQDNHNSVTLARSGAGKSYFTKLDLIRQLYHGVAVTVVDPEAEYLALAEHVGGRIIQPGQSGTQLNPLALPAEPDTNDELGRRTLFASTVIATILNTELSPDEIAASHRAVTAAYAQAGISDKPATWTNKPPDLTDVVRQLRSDTTGRQLASRLDPFVRDSSLFAPIEKQPADTGQAPLTVYDLSAVPSELTGVVTLIVLDEIWRNVRADSSRKLVYVDEAWLLLRQGNGADFLSRLAKSARKRSCGLAVVTQDTDDVLASDLGRTVINNASTQILLRQAPQAVDDVAEAFQLTGAERNLVATATRGDALLLSGDTHVAFRAIASQTEHRLCLTGLSQTEGEANQ